VAQIVTADIEVYDPSVQSTRTLRYATQGYVVGGAPAVEPTLDPRITFTRASTATRFNSAGVLETVAANTARFHYNPTTREIEGLLIEEARTNSIRNNTMQGAVAGTPGTLPTNWGVSGLGTLTQQIVGTGTANGITYIDVRFSGTTSTTTLSVIFDGSTVIAAANGQTWAQSIWTAVVAGSTANIITTQNTANLFDSGGVYLANVAYATPIFNTTSVLTRSSSVGTISTVGTAFIRPILALAFAAGVAIDITLRIGLPQLELGAFATSAIPTTTTALTRAADVASVNTLSPWYNASAGTLYAEFVVSFDSSTSIFPIAAYVSDGTFSNTVVLYERTVDDTRRGNIRVGGVQQFDQTNGSAYVYGTVAKTAIAFQTNDVAFSANGTSPTTSASTTIPTVNVLGLGSTNSLGGSLSPLNGYLRRITYYPRRLSNAELQSITV